MMSRTDKVVALGLALGAIVMVIAAFAGGASAANPAAGFEVAKFKVEVKGVQTTTLQHDHETTSDCDVSDFSRGQERVTFHSKPIVISAIHAPGTFNPEFFAGRRLGIPTTATVERNSTPVHSQPTGCEEDNGGGVPVVAIPDCGKRTQNPFLVKLEYAQQRSERDRLMLTVAQIYDDPYSDCEGAGPLAYPFLIDFNRGGRAISAKLSQDELFDPEFAKWISIAQGTDKEVTSDYSAETHIRWEVSFTRLKGR